MDRWYRIFSVCSRARKKKGSRPKAKKKLLCKNTVCRVGDDERTRYHIKPKERERKKVNAKKKKTLLYQFMLFSLSIGPEMAAGTIGLLSLIPVGSNR